MKQACLIFCFLSYILPAQCQLDASSGIAFRTPKGFEMSSINFMFFRLDIKKKNWVWNNEISFCKHQTYESYSYSGYSTGGGSSAYYSTLTRYHSYIRYTPLVIREGVDYSFDGANLFSKKGTASLRLGAFLQVDIPLEAEEYDKNCVKTSGNNSNPNHEYVVSAIDTTHDFTSAKPRIPYVALGLKLSRQIYFQHFFFSCQVGTGVYYKSRFRSTFQKESMLYDNQNLERQKLIYFKSFAEITFGIGYRFPSKKKAVEPSVVE
ncbi:MAG: hypothetical protein QE487_09255 [Fluviicola sp.]|nr:hypothetical protein [Fluviicola sp.]